MINDNTVVSERKLKDRDCWPVGVVFSNTGYLAQTERQCLKGTLLAISEINHSGGILDRPIVPVIVDPKSSDKKSSDIVQKMFVEHKVKSVFGCYRSSSRKAVLPIVERHGGLLWYPTVYEGFEYSPNCIYSGAGPNQHALALVEKMSNSFGSRVACVGCDYIYPRETNRLLRQSLLSIGGEVVMEEYLPMNASYRAHRMLSNKLHRNQVDWIFSTFVGETIRLFYTAFFESGLTSESLPILSATTTETELKSMAADVAQGHFSCGAYFHSLQTEKNESFICEIKKKFGSSSEANLSLQTCYLQTQIFAKALACVGEDDPTMIRSCALSSNFEAPQGNVTYNEETGHINAHLRLARADSNKKLIVLEESVLPINADPFLTMGSTSTSGLKESDWQENKNEVLTQ